MTSTIGILVCAVVYFCFANGIVCRWLVDFGLSLDIVNYLYFVKYIVWLVVSRVVGWHEILHGQNLSSLLLSGTIVTLNYFERRCWLCDVVFDLRIFVVNLSLFFCIFICFKQRNLQPFTYMTFDLSFCIFNYLFYSRSHV